MDKYVVQALETLALLQKVDVNSNHAVNEIALKAAVETLKFCACMQDCCPCPCCEDDCCDEDDDCCLDLPEPVAEEKKVE